MTRQMLGADSDLPECENESEPAVWFKLNFQEHCSSNTVRYFVVFTSFLRNFQYLPINFFFLLLILVIAAISRLLTVLGRSLTMCFFLSTSSVFYYNILVYFSEFSNQT